MVKKVISKDSTLWHITPKGTEKIKKQKLTPLGISEYIKSNEIKKSKAVIIISYDIPESLRRERTWIREVLKLLEFSMVHKSVWLGTSAIPEFLLKELSRRKILDCVQIFEITKKGTLEKLN